MTITNLTVYVGWSEMGELDRRIERYSLLKKREVSHLLQSWESDILVIQVTRFEWRFHKREDHLLINCEINFSHRSPRRATSRAEALLPLIVHVDQALLEHRDVFVNGKLFLSSTKKKIASSTCDTKRFRYLLFLLICSFQNTGVNLTSCGIYIILTVSIVTLTWYDLMPWFYDDIDRNTTGYNHSILILILTQ